MKKILVVLFVLNCMVIKVFSQDNIVKNDKVKNQSTYKVRDSKEKIRFGIQFGLLSATVYTGVSGFDVNAKTGYRFGGLMNIPVATHFALIPELVYVSKGAKFIGVTDLNGIPSNATETINFIEVPINFAYTSGIGKGFTAGSGITISYGVSGNAELVRTPSYANNFTTNDSDVFGDNGLKRLDIGCNIFAGYKFSQHFVLRAIYNFGLNNLNNNIGTFKTRYLALNAGFCF